MMGGSMLAPGTDHHASHDERYYSQLEPVDATVSSAISLTSSAAQQADRQSPSSPHHHNNNNNK